MRFSTRLSDSVHILCFIYLNPDENLSSERIAESVRTNPGYVRQLMSSLRNAGLISSTKGHAKPMLAKDAGEVTLRDVYKAIEGDKPLLHLDTHTNPECGVGVNIQLALREYYDRIQAAAEAEMERITLQNVLDGYHERIKENKR